VVATDLLVLHDGAEAVMEVVGAVVENGGGCRGG